MKQIVVSVNVHEKPDFVMKQLNNFMKFIKVKFHVILNCNDKMIELLGNNEEFLKIKNVILNPIAINKQRYHGSITNGICSNMKLACSLFKFDYFIVLSSRTFFYKTLDIHHKVQCRRYGLLPEKIDFNTWQWPKMTKTKLFKYIINNKKTLSKSPHEGLVFSFVNCNNILEFLKKNPDIETDLYNYPTCSEEFALQSIATAFSPYYYYYIGGHSANKMNIEPKNDAQFVHKVNR